MPTGIYRPYIHVNNVNWVYVPNTIVFNDGRGERVVRNQALGGGASEIVTTDNVETHIGMIKFQLRSNSENFKNTLILRDRFDKNVVVMSDPDSGFNLTFKQAVIINKIDYEVSAEGNFEIEFHSAIPV